VWPPQSLALRPGSLQARQHPFSDAFPLELGDRAEDVVYAPPSTWHATRFADPGPSCRLAISRYQFTSLLEQPQ